MDVKMTLCACWNDNFKILILAALTLKVLNLNFSSIFQDITCTSKHHPEAPTPKLKCGAPGTGRQDNNVSNSSTICMEARSEGLQFLPRTVVATSDMSSSINKEIRMILGTWELSLLTVKDGSE